MFRGPQICAKGRKAMATSWRTGALRAVAVKSARVACVAVVSMLPLVATAEAQSIDEARAAYAEGRFLEAAELAESLGTSEGFALASKSVAVQAYYVSPDDEKDALFERGLALEKAGPIRPGQSRSPYPIVTRHGQARSDDRRHGIGFQGICRQDTRRGRGRASDEPRDA